MRAGNWFDCILFRYPVLEVTRLNLPTLKNTAAIDNDIFHPSTPLFLCVCVASTRGAVYWWSNRKEC